MKLPALSVTSPRGRDSYGCHCTYGARGAHHERQHLPIEEQQLIRVTLLALLLIIGLVIGILLGGTSPQSSAGSAPVPSGVSTPPSVDLVAPQGASSTGSTGSGGDSDSSEPIPEPEPEPDQEPEPDPDPDPDPVGPDDLAPNPEPEPDPDPTTWRPGAEPRARAGPGSVGTRRPGAESRILSRLTTLDSRLAELQLVR